MKKSNLWLRVALAAVCLIAVQASPAQMVRYDGHRVVSVEVTTPEELERLSSMTDDVWTDGIGLGRLDVRVSPEQFARLQTSGLPYRVKIENVQALIDAQIIAPGDEQDAFDHYMPLDEVVAYLETLVALRPDLAETFVAGQTHEGRDIVGIRITSPEGADKPAVLYHGNQHAREWITVPAVVYIADKLIREYDSDTQIHELVDGVEWFLVPVMNPDGYVYSWTTDRMWRKNRRDNEDGTFGVDLNRNWSVCWSYMGSSGDTSSEVYHGPGPFSEPETQAMRDWILGHPSIVAYCDLHSYSQMIMHPYGCTPDPPEEPDFSEFQFLAATQSDIVLSVHGKYYEWGDVYTTIYPVGGGSVDYVYHEAGRFAFTWELRDTGIYGFLLPPQQIRPNCEEVFPALLFYAEYMSTPEKLVTPNGGEVWLVGQPYDIRWFAHGGPVVTSVDLYYSTDSGGTFPHVIATGEPHDGVYTWTLPDTPAAHCRVKLVIHYDDGTTAEDTSDADFVMAALLVTPPDDFESAGDQGGPFTPECQTYTLANVSSLPLDWTAAGTQTWLDVTPAYGTLAAGASTTVDVCINASADGLAPDTYYDTVSFTDTTIDVTRTRAVTLEVIAIPGEIEVADSIPPGDDLNMPFGELVIGQTRTEQVTISNVDADYDLLVTDITLRGGYAEDFSDGLAQDWDEDVDADWNVVDEEYVAAHPSPSDFWSMVATYGGQEWSDGYYEVAVRSVGSDEMRFIVVRATSDVEVVPLVRGSGYVFGVYSDLVYLVFKVVDGEFALLQDWTFTPHLNSPDQWNTLAVDCVGTTLRCYINGYLVWSGTDSSLAEGRIGLMCFTDPEAEATHYFDNVLVGDPRGAPAGRGVFSLDNLPTLPLALPPGDSFTFDVWYAPDTAEPHEARVLVESNDRDELEVTVDLSGTGVIEWLVGDLNCDGVVNGLDIDGFVLAVTGEDAYYAVYPDCDHMRADIDGNGRVDGFDIDPFVELLSGG